MVAFAACAPAPLATDDPPPAPDHVVATLNGDTADVVWHHDTATHFKLRRSPDGATFEGDGMVAHIALPDVGVSYWFSVEAWHDINWGRASDPSNTVQRANPPNLNVPQLLPPFGVTAYGTPGGAHVSWGSIVADSFVVFTDPPDQTRSVSGTSVSADITGLRNGVTYVIGVASLHGGRQTVTTWSDPIVPAGVPSAPLSVWAVPRSEGATVSWRPPATANGADIIAWEISAGTMTVLARASVLSVDVTGLTNGLPVSFTVRARNAAGLGDPSEASNSVTPADLSTAPLNVTAVRLASGSAQVSWSAPADSGGLPVQSYIVESLPAGAVESTADTTVTMSRLPTDVPVTFRVTAVTGVGAGGVSDASAPVLLGQ
jgi:hypothetical protein